MKTFLIALLIGATLAIVGFVAFRPSEPTYAQIQAEQRAADQAAQLAPIWTAAQALLILGIPVLLLGAGGVALWRFRNERKADAAGRLPVLRSDASEYQLAAMATLEQYHATEHQRAQIAPVPHSLSITQSPHYAPRMDYRSSVPEQLAQYALPSLEAAIALTLPDVVRLADVLLTVASGHLAYGMLTSGKLLTLP